MRRTLLLASAALIAVVASPAAAQYRTYDNFGNTIVDHNPYKSGDDKFYFNFGIGYAVATDRKQSNDNGTITSTSRMDNSLFPAAEVGYDFGEVRVGLDYSYRSFDIDGKVRSNATDAVLSSASANLNLHTVFANVYYDFEMFRYFVPYVGAGLGHAWLREGARDTGFGWQLIAGATQTLTHNVDLFFDYRYQNIDMSVRYLDGPGTSTSLDFHTFTTGVRYKF